MDKAQRAAEITRHHERVADLQLELAWVTLLVVICILVLGGILITHVATEYRVYTSLIVVLVIGALVNVVCMARTLTKLAKAYRAFNTVVDNY